MCVARLYILTASRQLLLLKLTWWGRKTIHGKIRTRSKLHTTVQRGLFWHPGSALTGRSCVQRLQYSWCRHLLWNTKTSRKPRSKGRTAFFTSKRSVATMNCTLVNSYRMVFPQSFKHRIATSRCMRRKVFAQRRQDASEERFSHSSHFQGFSPAIATSRWPRSDRKCRHDYNRAQARPEESRPWLTSRPRRGLLS